MLTRRMLSQQIAAHLDGRMTLEDLAAWAEGVFRTESFEAGFEDRIAEVLAILRDAVDPHRFRWEEPDLEEILDDLDG